MLAQKLSELRPGVSITIVEAGRSIFDFENRFKYRERMIKYGENPWPGDFIEDQSAQGIISRTMAVGGQALHWGGTCNRFSEEDLRLKSKYGLYVDWPIEWPELEKFYCEAERRLGVSGEPSPFPGDRRSAPYPMAPMPLTWSLDRLKILGRQERHPLSIHASGEKHGSLRRPRTMPSLRHLQDLPHRRALFAGFHLQAADRAKENHAARPNADPQTHAADCKERRSPSRTAVHREHPQDAMSIARVLS